MASPFASRSNHALAASATIALALIGISMGALGEYPSAFCCASSLMSTLSLLDVVSWPCSGREMLQALELKLVVV
jgi:hypothetical protein